LIAKKKGTPVGDVVVIMLDRPRHAEGVKAIREVGARIRFIPHGDVSASLAAVTPGSPVDLLWGIGGTPEGVLSASAIKCIGGRIVGRLWPRNDEERDAAIQAGYDLDEILEADRLVAGENVFFSATGVTDGDMLSGVHFEGPEGATTESLVMRSRSATVRTVHARHDRTKLREITQAKVG
jgi:fructose-1,6-bisphosphatase II